SLRGTRNGRGRHPGRFAYSWCWAVPPDDQPAKLGGTRNGVKQVREARGEDAAIAVRPGVGVLYRPVGLPVLGRVAADDLHPHCGYAALAFAGSSRATRSAVTTLNRRPTLITRAGKSPRFTAL